MGKQGNDCWDLWLWVINGMPVWTYGCGQARECLLGLMAVGKKGMIVGTYGCGQARECFLGPMAVGKQGNACWDLWLWVSKGMIVGTYGCG